MNSDSIGVRISYVWEMTAWETKGEDVALAIHGDV